jgi:aspartyl protease family protein
MRLVLVLLILAGAAAAAMFLPEDQLTLGLSPGELASAVASILVLVLILGSAGSDWRGRLGVAFVGAMAWVAIFAVVMAGYVYRHEVGAFTERMMDEIVPGRSVPAGAGEAVAIRRADGHFAFDMKANGVPMRFMFDTGASSVVLRAEDARRLGLDPDKLDYRTPVATANGRTHAAPITLETLSVGDITKRRVRALVARPGVLHENLLGQSFLAQLSGYAVERNRLVLRE